MKPVVSLLVINGGIVSGALEMTLMSVLLGLYAGCGERCQLMYNTNASQAFRHINIHYWFMQREWFKLG